MLNDLMPISYNYKYGTEVHIKPLSDLHVGSKQFSMDRFQAWRKNLKPTDKVVVVGDLLDNSVITGRLGHTAYEAAMPPGAAKELLYQMLEDIAPQIICGVSGNHEARGKLQDSWPLYDIFCRLKIEDKFRPSIAFLFIGIGKETTAPGRKRPLYVCAVTHGVSNGLTIGAGPNRIDRFLGYCDVDLLITGHTHKPVTWPSARIVADRAHHLIKVKQFTAVTATSMMDYGGYALEKMLPPAPVLTEQEIILMPRDNSIRVIQG